MFLHNTKSCLSQVIASLLFNLKPATRPADVSFIQTVQSLQMRHSSSSRAACDYKNIFITWEALRIMVPHFRYVYLRKPVIKNLQSGIICKLAIKSVSFCSDFVFRSFASVHQQSEGFKKKLASTFEKLETSLFSEA